MNFIQKLYHKFKLWYWWNYKIYRNEFHYSLNLINVQSEFLSSKNNLSLEELSLILTYRRDIAHELESGVSIKDIPTARIKKAKI